MAAGGPIIMRALRVLRINRQINIDVLMSIASIGAVLIGAYTEAAMVMVLYSIGSAMEGYTAGRARDAVGEKGVAPVGGGLADRPVVPRWKL